MERRKGGRQRERDSVNPCHEAFGQQKVSIEPLLECVVRIFKFNNSHSLMLATSLVFTLRDSGWLWNGLILVLV